MCLPSDFLQQSAPEYSAEERFQLLTIARQTIDAALHNKELTLLAPSEHLAENRAAFTTLHLEGHLRGCVGYVVPEHPLYRTVAETAFAAAFYDRRFVPVGVEEASRLALQISVLSPVQPISPEDVEVGQHGLIVSVGQQRGLLLPQVPIEQGWDRLTFLEQTCRKAGLSPDAWRNGAKLEAFTAEVFSE
ncbi:MAG TPA: AmmeMemoRadiSam system protein A [Clostridia bacterium]|nr:AmmeMemoRadiSam system protein A [Clostridia bacterium]